MYLGFVLIKYSKVHGHENSHEERRSYSQVSKNRNHNTPHRATQGRIRVGQEAERQVASLRKAFIVVFTAKKAMAG